MGWQTLPLGDAAALLLAAAALMGSPGPSTISLTAAAASFGPRRAIGYALGLILGTWLVLAVVATGISSVLASVPQVAGALTVASAAYILLLAVRIARAPPLSREDPAAPVPSVVGGFLLVAANPKAYVAISAVFAGARLGGLAPTAEALAKAALLAVMVVLIHLAWLLAGASLAGLLRDPRASRIVNIALAAILVATSILGVLPQ